MLCSLPPRWLLWWPVLLYLTLLFLVWAISRSSSYTPQFWKKPNFDRHRELSSSSYRPTAHTHIWSQMVTMSWAMSRGFSEIRPVAYTVPGPWRPINAVTTNHCDRSSFCCQEFCTFLVLFLCLLEWHQILYFFIKVKFTSHKIHHLKLNYSVEFSTLSRFWNYHPYQTPTHLPNRKRRPCTHWAITPHPPTCQSIYFERSFF
jgi:hypothetical protein